MEPEVGTPSRLVTESDYAWGRAELVLREAEIKGCKTYPDYRAMKGRWTARQREAGVTDAVRKVVIRAAEEQRAEYDRAWAGRQSA